MAKRGPKTKYDPKTTHVLIRAWAMAGKTAEQIAKELSVSKSTLYAWGQQHPQILDALNEGRDYANAKVEQSLYQRALGYEYEEVETSISKDGEKELKRVKKVKRRVPPDVTAQIFWLKNRRPDLWRDRIRDESDVIPGQDRVIRIRPMPMPKPQQEQQQANDGPVDAGVRPEPVDAESGRPGGVPG